MPTGPIYIADDEVWLLLRNYGDSLFVSRSAFELGWNNLTDQL